MWQEVKEGTRRPHVPPQWGLSEGWMSNSPFTRAMFRPLPTLSFTGLMILKKKRKVGATVGPPVWNGRRSRDSDLDGATRCEAEQQEVPEGFRPCFLRDPGPGRWAGFSRSHSGLVWTRAVCSERRAQRPHSCLWCPWEHWPPSRATGSQDHPPSQASTAEHPVPLATVLGQA